MNRKLILFGAGNTAKRILEAELCDIKVAYICDNDIKKWNTQFSADSRTFTIYPPDKLMEEDPNKIIVMITSIATVSIYYQLKNMGIINCFTWFRYVSKNNLSKLEKNADKIEMVSDLLADDHSRKIYSRVISFRVADEIDYSEINENNQYFVNDIFPLSDSEVFVDAGALEGDTIEGFLRSTGGNFKKIYSFEPNKKCFDILKNKFNSDKIVLYPYAVYNESVELRFDGNQIASGGEEIIKTLRIDDAINDDVTFIKMDVEGAELKALYGAENIIKKCLPKLAICLYHKLEDLWEIPLLINKWCPEYKLYIRHHSHVYYETVLYAILKA